MPGSGFRNNGAQMTTEWLCHQLLPRQIIDVDLPNPLPEHRLIKQPKRTKQTHDGILAWIQKANPQTHEDIANLVEYAMKKGIANDQPDIPEDTVFQSESVAIQSSLLSLWEGQDL